MEWGGLETHRDIWYYRQEKLKTQEFEISRQADVVNRLEAALITIERKYNSEVQETGKNKLCVTVITRVFFQHQDANSIWSFTFQTRLRTVR